MSQFVHVAAGAVFNDKGEVLIALRLDHKHQGGLWEFPGGKLEPGESVEQALRRELLEEVNIHVEKSRPLIRLLHHYADKSVFLDVWRIDRFSGNAQGKEQQQVKWIRIDELHEFQFPAANIPIIKSLQLPSRMLVTGQASNQKEFSLRLQQALENNIKLVQFRAKHLSEKEYIEWAIDGLDLCHQVDTKLVLNGDACLLDKIDADGIHFDSQRLMQCRHRLIPENKMMSASCHDLLELQQAEKLLVDFVCLSPVKPTSTHSGAQTLNWNGFQALVDKVALPVYALGGVADLDLEMAYQSGAQGVAAISAYWIGKNHESQ